MSQLDSMMQSNPTSKSVHSNEIKDELVIPEGSDDEEVALYADQLNKETGEGDDGHFNTVGVASENTIASSKNMCTELLA